MNIAFCVSLWLLSFLCLGGQSSAPHSTIHFAVFHSDWMTLPGFERRFSLFVFPFYLFPPLRIPCARLVNLTPNVMLPNRY